MPIIIHKFFLCKIVSNSYALSNWLVNKNKIIWPFKLFIHFQAVMYWEICLFSPCYGFMYETDPISDKQSISCWENCRACGKQGNLVMNRLSVLCLFLKFTLTQIDKLTNICLFLYSQLLKFLSIIF